MAVENNQVESFVVHDLPFEGTLYEKERIWQQSLAGRESSGSWTPCQSLCTGEGRGTHLFMLDFWISLSNFMEEWRKGWVL